MKKIAPNQETFSLGIRKSCVLRIETATHRFLALAGAGTGAPHGAAGPGGAGRGRAGPGWAPPRTRLVGQVHVGQSRCPAGRGRAITAAINVTTHTGGLPGNFTGHCGRPAGISRLIDDRLHAGE